MNKYKSFVWFIAAIGFAVVATQCTCKHGPKIPLDEIDVEIVVHRFDHDIFRINTDSIDNEIDKLKATHSEFLNLFSEGVIGIGLPNDTGYADYLQSFISDKMVTEAYNDVQRVFPTTEKLDKILSNAFKRYRYYFPEKPIPTIYGFVSGYNNSVVLADGILGIGFDRYLGRDNEVYPRLGVHNYISYNMHPDKIPSDLLRTWAIGEFHFNDSIDNLLNNIVYEGMLMYFTKRMLPEQSDSLILGFSPQQMDWCKSNESEMWAYLIENKLLFTTESFTIKKFVNDAPFSQNFTRESPGRAAVWLGYRIVDRFMQKNKDFTLAMLMTEKDYQKVLNMAKYNP